MAVTKPPLQSANWGQALNDALDALDASATAARDRANHTGTQDASSIGSGVLSPDRLGTGSRTGSKFLRDDGVWQTTPTGGGTGAGVVPVPLGASVPGGTATGSTIARRGVGTARVIGTGTQATASSPTVVTLTDAANVGETIIACIQVQGTGVAMTTAPFDTAGNVWYTYPTQSFWSTLHNVAVSYAPIQRALITGDSVTLNTGRSRTVVILLAVPGLLRVGDAGDKSSVGGANSAAVTTNTTPTISQAEEFAIALIGRTYSTTTTFTQSAQSTTDGWSLLSTQASGPTTGTDKMLHVAVKKASAVETETYTGTLSPAATYASLLVTFKADLLHADLHGYLDGSGNDVTLGLAGSPYYPGATLVSSSNGPRWRPEAPRLSDYAESTAGVVGRGNSTKDTQAFIEAFADSKRMGAGRINGGPGIRLPAGVLRLESPLVWDAPVPLIGEGSHQTYIKPVDAAALANQFVFSISGLYRNGEESISNHNTEDPAVNKAGFIMKGMTWLGDRTYRLMHGVGLKSTNDDVFFDDVDMKYWPGCAFQIGDPYPPNPNTGTGGITRESLFRHVRVIESGDIGNLTDANFPAGIPGMHITQADFVGRTVTDGAMTAGSAVFSSATLNSTTVDVGQGITVTGAGVGGATLSTTILSRTSATQVTLAVAASTSVTNATAKIVMTSDGLNQLNFESLWYVWNPARLWIRNQNTTETARRIEIENFMLHGPRNGGSTWATTPDDLMVVTGLVAGLIIDGFRTNSSHPGKYAVRWEGNSTGTKSPQRQAIRGIHTSQLDGGGFKVDMASDIWLDGMVSPGDLNGTDPMLSIADVSGAIGKLYAKFVSGSSVGAWMSTASGGTGTTDRLVVPSRFGSYTTGSTVKIDLF
jgi:hypothetical protein